LKFIVESDLHKEKETEKKLEKITNLYKIAEEKNKILEYRLKISSMNFDTELDKENIGLSNFKI